MQQQPRLAPAAIALAIVCAGAAFGQAVDAHPSFDVASVKPHDPASAARFSIQGGPGTSDPDRFTCRNCSLRSLLTAAYDIKEYQLFSPAWSERFDIVANVPDGTTKEQFRLMLQNLLTDRFRLTMHREKREVYNLVAAKDGPKLTPSRRSSASPDSDPSAAGPSATLGKDGFPVPPPGVVTTTVSFNGDYRMNAIAAPVTKLVSTLSNLLGRPVSDGTGLTGEYDFRLAWWPDVAEPRRQQDGSPVPSAPDADSGPTLFGALQTQLGLRLEPMKGQVDVLVIDHAEKAPTGN